MIGSATPRDAVSGSAQRPKSEMLCKLQRREITLDQYLDHIVKNTVAHLTGRISTEQLEYIQNLVREQIMTDPVVVQYVERATGMNPASTRAS